VKKYVLLSLLFVVSSVFADTAKVTMTDPSKSIMVQKKSPSFTINLSSNITTGYSWYLVKYNTKLLRAIREKYVKPDHNVPGAGGYQKWIFKAKSDAFNVPRITKIKMIYARPWDLQDVRPVSFIVVLP